MTSWLLREIGIDVVILIFILLLLLIAASLWMQVLGLAGQRAHLQAIEEALRKAADRDEDRARSIAALRGRMGRVERRLDDEWGAAPETFFWDRMLGKVDRKGGA
ncbi:hypothetical protein [Phreatobacter stygius]|uniref:Uncharacterized protein n=1 Tax=Phreatobacter stygius TaxID=1940610 RepID=A0A4D7BAR5_9HYPH|nr:hypothetical protein [Phreatobacter stygius]QCI67228.1 hypothetical protein E8M01_25135 [Phreatobacter stygius]